MASVTSTKPNLPHLNEDLNFILAVRNQLFQNMPVWDSNSH
jgi:hypothetical protein